MYKPSNISVIIPTYNRAKDLEKTLGSFKNSIKSLNEVIIIDQSANDETKSLVNKLKNNKIKYIYSSKPSLTRARNLGISRASRKSELICFIDDDVTLDKDYFAEIVKVFNENLEAKAVAGYFKPNKEFGSIETVIRRIFFLNVLENNKVNVSSVYGNSYARKLDRTVNSQWIPGVNMVFKREVFNKQKFDEHLEGYALGEDFDFTYRLYQKHPNSLFITPFAKLIHRASGVERYPDEKMAYVNQINHFYLNFKNFNSTIGEKITFVWMMFGISLLRTSQLLKLWGKKDMLKLKFHFGSLFYCLKNLRRIKRGNLTFRCL